jgi:hypothetical protein
LTVGSSSTNGRGLNRKRGGRASYRRPESCRASGKGSRSASRSDANRSNAVSSDAISGDASSRDASRIIGLQKSCGRCGRRRTRRKKCGSRGFERVLLLRTKVGERRMMRELVLDFLLALRECRTNGRIKALSATLQWTGTVLRTGLVIDIFGDSVNSLVL